MMQTQWFLLRLSGCTSYSAVTQNCYSIISGKISGLYALLLLLEQFMFFSAIDKISEEGTIISVKVVKLVIYDKTGTR